MNARNREEEYLRRMKALGYEPSLNGMDDGDIEWKLSKMEEADRRRAAEWQQPEQTVRTVYRPVDPGLKARILRMFGQPHDESAIPKEQEFYLNGWDNGEEEEVRTLVSQREQRKTDFNAPDSDPWKNAWKLDWGEDGNPLTGPQRMDHWPRRDGAMFPSRGDAFRPLSYTTGGNDVNTGGRGSNTAAANTNAGGYADGGAYGDMTLPQGERQAPVNNATGGGAKDASTDRGLAGYLYKLGERESSNNYKAKNEGSYLGKYQLGSAALIDAGFYNYGDGEEKSGENLYNGTWTDKARAYGVNSYEDFLNSPEAQEAAIREYNNKIWGYIRDGGYDKYIGQKIHGVEVTASGLLAACHLGGIDRMPQLFGKPGRYETDKRGVPVDGNGKPMDHYLNDMGGLDLTELLGYNPDRD